MENNQSFIEKLSSALQSFSTGIEEWQVQAVLGKAEAKDKWEEYQKKLKLALHEGKHDFENGTGTIGEIRNKLEQLEVQLALGKAEAKDLIDEKTKTIKLAIHELQQLISGLKE